MQSVPPLGQQEWQVRRLGQPGWIRRAAGLLQESGRPQPNLASQRSAQQSRLAAFLQAAQCGSQQRRGCGLARQVFRQRGLFRRAGHRLPRRASQCPGAQDWAGQEAMRRRWELHCHILSPPALYISDTSRRMLSLYRDLQRMLLT